MFPLQNVVGPTANDFPTFAGLAEDLSLGATAVLSIVPIGQWSFRFVSSVQIPLSDFPWLPFVLPSCNRSSAIVTSSFDLKLPMTLVSREIGRLLGYPRSRAAVCSGLDGIEGTD
jgi:hypothetical protein